MRIFANKHKTNKSMKITDLFKKKSHKPEFGDYSLSSHAAIYEQIAKKLGTTPQHVYELAHGKGIECYDDRVILSELGSAGILHY